MQSAAPVAGIAAPKTAVMSKPLSERVVAYQIDAHVDTRRKTIDATEVLTYHDLTGHPQDTFPFHLYLNAFQPTSTLMREIRRDRPQFEWQDKYRALAEVKSFEVAGIGDLTSQIRFISPDDGNPEDRTVFQVKLTRPVAPGESVQFKIAFRDQLGVVFERTGYKRDFIMGAQWFPKVGVWWQGAWNKWWVPAARRLPVRTTRTARRQSRSMVRISTILRGPPSLNSAYSATLLAAAPVRSESVC